ncbi:MAG: nitroreductase/quinone reductase family protein [Chloroflexota bacterium]
MTKFHQLPKPFFRLIKLPPQIAYALGLGPLMGRLVLLLTTTGRKTGKPRVTPLQYEEVGEEIYVGASRGLKSDWVRNILADPHVEVRVKSRGFQAFAKVITDPARIADFLELRLQRRPRMIGAMMKAEGLPSQPDRAHLEEYAENLAVVVIKPVSGSVS